jgi:hypothetical protein
MTETASAPFSAAFKSSQASNRAPSRQTSAGPRTFPASGGGASSRGSGGTGTTASSARVRPYSLQVSGLPFYFFLSSCFLLNHDGSQMFRSTTSPTSHAVCCKSGGLTSPEGCGRIRMTASSARVWPYSLQVSCLPFQFYISFRFLLGHDGSQTLRSSTLLSGHLLTSPEGCGGTGTTFVSNARVRPCSLQVSCPSFQTLHQLLLFAGSQKLANVPIVHLFRQALSLR